MHSIDRVQHWKNTPGNWDVLNFANIFASDELFDIPPIAKDDIEVSNLIQWGSKPKLLASPLQGTCIHFFLDDYRFESVWKNPARSLEIIQHRNIALTPDFSIWADMPKAMQIWNVYRNRYIGAYWQSNGVHVIPTISWAEPDGFCFAGVERGSQVAISTLGVIRDKSAYSRFNAGFEKMIEVIRPWRVLCYGTLAPLQVKTETPVTVFPTRWQQFHAKLKS